MSKVVLISPPYMKLSHPEYKIPLALSKGCEYMNPGLLIASTVLDEKNIGNKIVKINDLEEDKVLQAVDKDTILVGISCTCAWEYLESLKIAEIIKKENPNVKIALAGWQVKGIKEKVFSDSSDVDYVVLGDAENTMQQLYEKAENKLNVPIWSVLERDKSEVLVFDKSMNVDFCCIDFKKFPEFKKYVPFVEESRNCPYSCSFCLNSCVVDRYQNVPFDIFKKNVDMLEQIYGPNAQANLLAANFGVNYKETKLKLDYLKTKKIQWNIELHVDNHWEEYVDELEAAGVTKVSIGFESGSPKILRLMNKTNNPQKYLDRLTSLLTRLNAQGIKPSLNLLIDYRETKETIAETLMFLTKNKDKIKKVKANFMFAFGNVLNKVDYSYKPNIINDEYSKKIHALPVLPQNLNLEDVSELIDKLESGCFDIKILDDIKGLE